MSEEKQSLISTVTEHSNYGSTAIEGGSRDSTSSSSTASSSTNEDINSIRPFADDQMKSTLTFINKIGFGLGHVYNDLCAGVWFSYTLLFMQGALTMPSAEAGALVMLGQVGDAIATPIIGILADKFSTKRKWHIAGTGLVFLSFPLIFSICPWCSNAPIWWQPTYFAITILIFQLGWAIVQITHLSIIPELSRTQKDRSDLTAIRYSASVCSNVVVYIVTWAVLHARNKTDNNIGPNDAYRFRDISLILTLIGFSMTVCFQFSLSLSGYNTRRQQAFLRQKNTRRQSNDDADIEQSRTDPIPSTSDTASESLITSATTTTTTPPVNIRRRKKNFFKSPLLYQNAFLYVFSRLFMTTALVYMPLWLDERSWSPIVPPSSSSESNRIAPIPFADSSPDDKSVENIATVPLVSFLASFMASMALKYTNQYFGHKIEYLLGSICSISVCAWVALAVSPTASLFSLYGIAVLFGVSSSVTMISSLCITADMIGVHADQGGFIYSAVTFADKLITGIVVVIIETLKCHKRDECPEYYRNVLAYACGTAAVLGLFTLSTLQCNRRRPNRVRPN